MTNKHFIFDFDGVLFDTATECLSLAFEAVTTNPARWKFAREWQGLESPPVDVAEAFIKHRYWVGPPWQYSVLLKVIAEKTLLTSTESFLELCGCLKADHEEFTQEYFAARKRQSADPIKWLQNMKPIAKSCEVFQSLGDSTWILSTRDPESICKIHNSLLGTVFPAERLLPRAGEKEKWELLVDFGREHNAVPESIFFLDDYVSHALPAKQHGFASHLASWGYLGPQDLADASSSGLPVLGLDELEHAVELHRHR